MNKLKVLLALGTILSLVWLISYQLIIPTSVQAAISGCSATVHPTTIASNNTASLNFTVTNTDPTNTVNWVRIARPSSRYTVSAGSSSGWSGSVSNPDSVIFTGSTITAGSNQTFTITVDTSPIDTGSQSWSIDSSDDGGGSTTGCGGASTSISSDTTPPVISNIQTSNLGDNTVTITWTTDESSGSSVEYGLSVGYGQSGSGSGSTTSHSVTLNNLTAGTTYHFRVNSADTVGNNAQSGDNSFTTTGSSSSSSSSSSSTTTTTTSTPAPTATPKPTPVADKTPPQVNVTTDLSKPLKVAPVIIGVATDNVAVAKVEYSLDNGVNWLPAILGSKNSVRANFSINLGKLDDGNYQFVVRATDTSGNFNLSSAQTLVIDQLPPDLGGNLFMNGLQVAQPSLNGELKVLVGQKVKLVLSAIGGATQVVLNLNGQNFNLTQSTDTRLWSGEINLDQTGSFDLNVQAEDGAGNKVEKVLGKVTAVGGGQVRSGEAALKNAWVNVYYFNSQLNQFVLWDGRPFGQTNPQKTDEAGRYNLSLPAGKYYLKVEAPNLQSSYSGIFTLDQTRLITSNFDLSKGWVLNLGGWKIELPNLWAKNVDIASTLAKESVEDKKSQLIGEEFPLILPTPASGSAKSQVVGVLQSWFPSTGDQLTKLNNLNKIDKVPVLTLFPLESSSSVQYLSRKYKLQIDTEADPKGSINSSLNLHALPAFLFLDQKGVIRSVTAGQQNQNQLEQNLLH
jgi:hypothetical protein